MLAALLALSGPPFSSAALLPPPRVIGPAPTHGCVELRIAVSDHLEVSLFEADLGTQNALVDEALDEATKAGSAAEDPYGAVLWPAAQVVAIALVAALESTPRPCTVLELGAGTGLCSIAAAACGANTIATDYRDEPLELLRSAAQHQAERLGSAVVATRLFDITDASESLPESDAPLIVCAADLLYMKSTSVALAARCVEALRRPNTVAVLVGDLGRPGRPAFLEALVSQGIREESARFEAVEGYGAPTARHELISSARPRADDDAVAAAPLRASVGLMRLTAADLRWEHETSS